MNENTSPFNHYFTLVLLKVFKNLIETVVLFSVKQCNSVEKVVASAMFFDNCNDLNMNVMTTLSMKFFF